MTETRYRVGIVGCGRVGCAFDDDPRRGYVSTHAGAYALNPDVDLVALADLDPERTERYGEKFGVHGRFTDYRRMLAEEALDIVSVCTPPATHREVVEAAAEAGVRAVFCEKPISESMPSADAMIRACREAGLLLMIDHQRRFDRFHQQIADFIQDEGLGRIQQVTCYYTAGLANSGSHLVDLLRMTLGDPIWASGITSANASRVPGDENVDGWIQFRSGPLAVLQALDVREFAMFELSFLGSRGRLRLTAHGAALEFEDVQRSERFAAYRELRRASPPIVPPATQEYMLQAVDHLVGCLREGLRPRCTGEDGRGALEIVCALRESAAAGGARVALPMPMIPSLPMRGDEP